MEEGRQLILLHINDSSKLTDPQLTCDWDYPPVLTAQGRVSLISRTGRDPILIAAVDIL